MPRQREKHLRIHLTMRRDAVLTPPRSWAPTDHLDNTVKAVPHPKSIALLSVPADRCSPTALISYLPSRHLIAPAAHLVLSVPQRTGAPAIALMKIEPCPSRTSAAPAPRAREASRGIIDIIDAIPPTADNSVRRGVIR